MSNQQATPAPTAGTMPYRVLGRTGARVSALGLGGFHLGMARDEAESIRIVRTAVDRGVTFLDNCWDYHNGVSEVRMGRALRDGYRQRVYLMTKVDGRTREAAARQIDESLLRLQTDCIDLVQFHEVIRFEDPDRIFAPGGAAEALVEARTRGKIRHVGFTGHKDPAIHLRMLEVADAAGFRFDAVQMPLNVMDAHFRSFEKQVLPVLVERGIAVLGMKPLGGGKIVESGVASATECLHYALNLPTSVVITGCESVERLEQALDAALTFRPPTPEAIAELLGRTATLAATGRCEPFKTTTDHDGTAFHLDWLG